MRFLSSSFHWFNTRRVELLPARHGSWTALRDQGWRGHLWGCFVSAVGEVGLNHTHKTVTEERPWKIPTGSVWMLLLLRRLNHGRRRRYRGQGGQVKACTAQRKSGAIACSQQHRLHTRFFPEVYSTVETVSTRTTAAIDCAPPRQTSWGRTLLIKCTFAVAVYRRTHAKPSVSYVVFVDQDDTELRLELLKTTINTVRFQRQ